MGTDAEEAKMKEFCAAVGELILWANLIDHQLNQALIAVLALPEHPFIEPIVAQLDARPKAELLKKRVKFLPAGNDWRKRIRAWVERAEKANSNRNIVAHHRVAVDGEGGITLVSSQLTKVFDAITPDMKPAPKRGLAEVREWVRHAQAAADEGQVVLANLAAFAAKARPLLMGPG